MKVGELLPNKKVQNNKQLLALSDLKIPEVMQSRYFMQSLDFMQ